MIRSFGQNNASMRPTKPHDRALDGTHGRIKRRKKSFYEMKKAAYANLICYRLKRFRKEKVLIFQGVPGTKKGDFEDRR